MRNCTYISNSSHVYSFFCSCPFTYVDRAFRCTGCKQVIVWLLTDFSLLSPFVPLFFTSLAITVHTDILTLLAISYFNSLILVVHDLNATVQDIFSLLSFLYLLHLHIFCTRQNSLGTWFLFPSHILGSQPPFFLLFSLGHLILCLTMLPPGTITYNTLQVDQRSFQRSGLLYTLEEAGTCIPVRAIDQVVRRQDTIVILCN